MSDNMIHSALPLRLLSLGAGVQSTVPALMACRGDCGPNTYLTTTEEERRG
ncbi:hypothetical protein [Nocardia puris]|uniref:Uncharacterized protein n=1 Tax=Nocardia puris TaxID=208602 RepID=A0A366CSI2_9NOCA|nr:hypothetical protein [Nocardia puris]RBO78311.1 hypothetical protein DFR74_1525 [Nocardia puris]